MGVNRPSVETTLFYRIKCGAAFDFIGTDGVPAGQPKDTYLYVSGDGRLRRWWLENPTADTNAQWLIYPSLAGNGELTYVFQTLRIPRKIVGRDPVRWIRIWDPEGGSDGSPNKNGSQCFKLVSAGGNWCNIQVVNLLGFESWVFDVDHLGFVSLQPPNGNDSQKFTFEAVEGSERQKPAFRVTTDKWCRIQEMPGPPMLTNARTAAQPRTTESKFIAEEIIPGAQVNDPNYNDKLVQVKDHPYYHLQWESYWDSTGNESFTQHQPNTASEETMTVEIGFSSVIEDEFKKTIGVAFSVGASASDPVSGLGAEAAFKVTNSEETRNLTRKTRLENTKQSKTVKISATPHATAVQKWRRVNLYTLRAMNTGTVQKQWQGIADSAMSVYPDLKVEE